MPAIKKGESQKDYIGRCIPYVMREGTARDNKQAAAICYSLWKQKNGKHERYRKQQSKGPGE